MSKMAQLPPGLDPVTAGRFGLWLLGQRSRARAQKRTVTPSRVWGYGTIHEFLTLTVPWTIEEYPGYRKFLASLCGVGIRTSDHWLYGCGGLPKRHAKRLAMICRERGGSLLRLADEFEALAAVPDRPKGLRRENRTG